MSIEMKVVRKRLQNQRLAGNPLPSVPEVVRWFGAVQAQDYHGAKWSVAQRTKNPASAEFDQLFNAGACLRVHAMRPTWHFVAPEDLLWIQRLTRARVHAANAYQYRRLEIDRAAIKRCRALLDVTLDQLHHPTRDELAAAFAKGGLPCDGSRLAYLLMQAELEGVLCSGPLQGKQFTYARVEERVKTSRPLDGEEALGELARRYFRSHGPATAHDFAWWSGLTLNTAKIGIRLLGTQIVADPRDGLEYWRLASNDRAPVRRRRALLVSIYDEHLVSYKDRRHSFAPELREKVLQAGRDTTAVVLIDGWVVGQWGKSRRGRGFLLTVKLFRPLIAPEKKALQQAAETYAQFLDAPVELSIAIK